MYRYRVVGCAAVVVLAIGSGQGRLYAAETNAEIRNHVTVKTDLQVPEKLAINGVTEVAGPVDATLLLRNWYNTPPKGGRWTIEGALRREVICLVEVPTEHLRFGWWSDRRFDSGKATYTLRIWHDPAHPRVLTWTVEGFPVAKHMAEQMSRDRATGSPSVDDSQLLTTFDFAGRKLVVPTDEWTHGLSPGEPREWLATVVDESLKHDLRTIGLLAESEAQLGIACTFVAQPLLGLKPGACDSSQSQVLKVGRNPDCSFDASFGEPCSLADSLNSSLKKQPQVAPPPKP